jgi:hypothetical protein
VLYRLGKLIDFGARLFHAAAAFKIGLPLRCLGKGPLRIFVDRLGHQGNQIADHTRMIKQ